MQLVDDEGREEHQPGGQGGRGRPVGPPALGSLDDPPDEAPEAAERQRAAERVEGHVRVARRRDDHGAQQRDGGGQGAEGDLDAAPPRELQEDARERQPQQRAGAGDRGPHAARRGPALRRVGVDQHRQRGRHDRRAPGPGQPPQDDVRGVGDQPGRRAAGGEGGQPGQQRRAPPEAVGGDAERQQQGGEGQRARVDRPRQLGLRGPRGARDLRHGQGRRRAGGDDQREGCAHDGEQRAESAPDRPDGMLFQTID
ncbi:hypothetical protein JOD57_004841 [Geodermatophilus bullaregiensis]|nr:hypothetical protein [Geodermatophilus bullaregiensis]MBM7809004.1 hypothetical protein [Geodermatophilus bullaregiensis]